MGLRAGFGIALLCTMPAWMAVATAAVGSGDSGAPDPLAISQNAIGGAMRDVRLVDRQGGSHRLHDLMDKPVVISMIYTGCVHSCSVTTRHLGEVVRKARESLGAGSFRVLTIGFDVTADTPAAMAEYARRYRIEEPDWRFLSLTDDVARDRLVEDLGFVYQTSPRGFDHTVQATVVDPAGRVYRQVYGELFGTPLLVEPLKDLVLGRPAADEQIFAELSRRIRWFCTVYDARTDRYHFDYSMFMGLVIGALVIGLVIAWLGVELRARNRGGIT